MSRKASLSLAAFAVIGLLVAGISYWAIRETSQSGPPPRNVAEAPPSPVQSPPALENSPQVGQGKQASEPPAAQTSPPSTAPTAPSDTATATSQPTQPPVPSRAPSTSAAPGQSREGTSEKPPPSAAMALAMPDEEKMSAANRRQVQEALHRLGYYDGPVDGFFGPLTRAAIQRFQDSVGEKGTGRLTAAEAGRLVSVTGPGTGAGAQDTGGLGTGTGAQGTGGLGISEAPVGHRQSKPADLPPSVLQKEQENVPAPDNPPAAQNNARVRGGSKRDSGSTGNTGAYGQIPSICTGC